MHVREPLGAAGVTRSVPLSPPRVGPNASGAFAAAVLAAVSVVGCARTTQTYAGTATLLTSGATTSDVSARTVRFVDCSERARPRYVLDLGDACSFVGRWSSGVFVGESGGECVLPTADGPEQVLRVSDVSARYAVAGRWPDGSVVDVRIGGELVSGGGAPRHTLLTFSGVFVSSEERGSRCVALGLQ
jgi:hypothetical protein